MVAAEDWGDDKSTTAIVKTILARGETATLDHFGGLDGLIAARDELVGSPFLDILVTLAISAPADALDRLGCILLDGFARSTSPVTFRDAANLLIDNPDLHSGLGSKLAPVLIARIADRSDPNSELIAAYALEALFRLSLAGTVNRHQVLGILTDIGAQEGELFAMHAAKLLGAAFAQWGGEDVIATLERLLSPAEAEAGFELGLIALSEGLEQESIGEIVATLEAAQIRFRQSAQAGEERSDAVAYDAVIDIVRAFAGSRPATELEASLSRLDAAIADRRGLLQMDSLPAWLAPRADREIAWVELARKTRQVAADLSRPSWLNAAATLNDVLMVYDAERTMMGGSGLSVMLRPPIEAAFVRERGLVEHLDQLLKAPELFAVDRESANALRDRIHRRTEEDTAARMGEESATFPLLARALQGLSGADQLPQESAAALEAALGQFERRGDHFANPVLNRLFTGLTEELAQCVDYQGGIKDDFDTTIKQIIGFCADRQDAGLKQLGARAAYLRSHDAKEGDLQSDLRQWLKGNLTSAEILPEVEGIATGRTDLYIGFGGTRFIAELKRHHGAVNRNVATAYFGQAGSYQATNVRLGFLGILELVDRPGPPPAIEETIWYAQFVPAGSQLARHLVVFRVPGMLKSPSSMH